MARRAAVVSVMVAACALLVCVAVLVGHATNSGPQSLAALCAIPPCAKGTAETDRLATIVRGLKGKLAKLNGMMGSWQVLTHHHISYHHVCIHSNAAPCTYSAAPSS